MEGVQPGPACYDPALQAWVLSRHEDVGEALREPRLSPVDSPDPSAHLAMRDAMARTLSRDRLAAWRPAFEYTALGLALALPTDRPLDLVASYAAPWALSLAVAVTGASPADAAHLARLAREVFLAAAARTDPGEPPAGHAPAVELARCLPASEAMTNVQVFVALSQTLPHLLAGAWLELFGNPPAGRRLREAPHLVPQAVEELLRLSGPSRSVFRHALADVRIGDAAIARGDRVILLLAAANRDPARFPDPDHVDLSRPARDHLSFGGGAHACSGARLVRAAASAATGALLRTTDEIELVAPVEWIDELTIRAPATLPAVLHATPPRNGQSPPSG